MTRAIARTHCNRTYGVGKYAKIVGASWLMSQIRFNGSDSEIMQPGEDDEKKKIKMKLKNSVWCGDVKPTLRHCLW